MPRIDDPKLKHKVFKKETMRAWDRDLLRKLTIRDDSNIDANKQEPNNKEEQSPTQQVIIVKNQNTEKSGSFKELASEKQLGFNQGSIRVQDQPGIVVHSLLQETNSGLLKNVDDIAIKIARLSGLEKSIFFLINDICTDRCTCVTGEFLSINFDRAIGAPRNSRETAIKRLVKKGLLVRSGGKTGLNGTLNFAINDIIKNEAAKFVNNQNKHNILGQNTATSYPRFKKIMHSEEEKELVD